MLGKWTQKNIPGVDARLCKRDERQVKEHMNASEALSAGIKALPEKTHSFASVQAAWRFYKNEAITLKGLQQPLLEHAHTAVQDRWLWPDVFKNQDTSVAKAKKAITDYKKDVGKIDGLAELMVFYCERAAGFSMDIGLQDEGFFDALVRMFEQALKTIAALPDTARPALLDRLDDVRRISHNFGYGVGDDMDELLAEHGIHD